MNNKSVEGFVNKSNKTIKYGKWFYNHCGNVLYFGHRLVAEYKNGVIVCHNFSIVDCDFEYNTFHAINKVIKYIENN